QTMEVPASAPVWWRRPLAIVGGIGIVVLLVGAVSVWRAPGRRAATAISADGRRIAVLYFDDKSENHSLGAVADGLTEELIRSLSTAPSLTIISRSGVERYRGGSAATDSIARALRAGYVVRGELEPEGDRVRVNVRLYDGS